jgi:hypothetical protein
VVAELVELLVALQLLQEQPIPVAAVAVELRLQAAQAVLA